MQTFADWLHYYNDLNVAPRLEALEKMRAFYTDKGIDILKDTVSPCKEAYGLLKKAVVGGQSLLLKRYH